MSLPLKKKTKLSLTKAVKQANIPVTQLTKAVVGAGWDASHTNQKTDIDLFAVAIIDEMEKRKVGLFKAEQVPTGRKIPGVCYFGQQSILNGAIMLDEDNIDGEDKNSKINGRSDDEHLFINFDELPASCNRVCICLNFYNAGGRTFKDVKKLFARLHINEVEVLTADISENPEKDSATAVHYLDFIRNDEGTWDAEFIEEYHRTSNIKQLANKLVGYQS